MGIRNKSFKKSRIVGMGCLRYFEERAKKQVQRPCPLLKGLTVKEIKIIKDMKNLSFFFVVQSCECLNRTRTFGFPRQNGYTTTAIT